MKMTLAVHPKHSGTVSALDCAFSVLFFSSQITTFPRPFFLISKRRQAFPADMSCNAFYTPKLHCTTHTNCEVPNLITLIIRLIID